MTHPSRRRPGAALAAALALSVGACLAQAPSWKPDHAVTLVVPYAPGGGTDAQARAVARQLQAMWGQPVVVDNTAGADGLIGTRKVIDARPDGHTLLVQIPSLTLIRHTPAFKGIDPLGQLVPVSEFSSLPGVFVVNARLPVKSLAELVRHCKAAEPPCSVGTTENAARMQARQFGAETGLDNLVVANYKGGGQLVTDLVANNVNVGIMGQTAVLQQHKAGALRIVATMGRRRSPALPDVPTVAEAGFPDFTADTWYGVFAPRGTPAPVVDGIAAAVREAVKDEAVKKAFAAIGSEPVGSTPAEFAAQVREESGRMAGLAKRFPIE